MKKNIVLAAIFSVFTFAINAQNAVGGRLGATWNNAVSRDLNGTLDFTNMSSFSVGAFYELGIDNNFFVQPEINFTEKGFRVEEGTNVNLFGVNLPIGASAVTVVRYLDMPVLAKYKFGNTEGVRAYVAAGPSLGYAMNGTLQTRARLLVDVKIADTPIDLTSTNYNRFELGGVVGAGVEIPVSFGKIQLDGRYTRSLMDVYELPVVGSRIRNQGFGFSVGFSIDLGTSSIKNRKRA